MIMTSKKPEVNLSFPPGLVGDIARWAMKTSRIPDQTLAVGVALSTVATLLGRYKIASPTGMSNQLYVICLAPTGFGKEHYLRCARLILEPIDRSLFGRLTMKSGTGLVRYLEQKPVSTCGIDEIGSYLRRVNGKRASEYEKAVGEILRTIFGIHFDPYETPMGAKDDSKRIPLVHLSIFGISTTNEFYDALKMGDISNGFLNRLLVLRTKTDDYPGEPEIQSDNLPEEIKEQIRRFSQERVPQGTDLLDGIQDPGVHRLSWESDAAYQYWKCIEYSQIDRMKADPRLDGIISREAYITLRVATIIAYGESGMRAKVSLDHVRWAKHLVCSAFEQLVEDAEEHMAETDHQYWRKRVLKAIRNRSKKTGKCKLRDICQGIKGEIPTKDIQNHIEELLHEDVIEKIKDEGNPQPFYRVKEGK